MKLWYVYGNCSILLNYLNHKSTQFEIIYNKHDYSTDNDETIYMCYGTWSICHKGTPIKIINKVYIPLRNSIK